MKTLAAKRVEEKDKKEAELKGAEEKKQSELDAEADKKKKPSTQKLMKTNIESCCNQV